MKSRHESVRLPEPLLERVVQLSEATGWSRARVIRDFLSAGFSAVFNEPNRVIRESQLKVSVVSAAKWHGNNAASRQLGLFKPTSKAKRGRSNKRR